jgi:hypothetical protein
MAAVRKLKGGGIAHRSTEIPHGIDKLLQKVEAHLQR